MNSPIFIVGPTASGKSAVAVEVARRLGVEVASMDAFQIYRGLDIGTGKPSKEERQGIRHHLMDVVDPLESFSVADYMGHAGKLVAAASAPLVWAGGTGLYFRALRQGLSPAPASDLEIVAALEARPLKELVCEIKGLDPEWALEADLENPRRVIRALAVAKATGKPLSWWHAQPAEALLPGGKAFLLQWPVEVLKERIARRVEAMWTAGWPGETERLLLVPGWEESQSAKALGYADVMGFLRGGMNAEECRKRIVTSTWQYARRQLTWFRRELNLQTIEIDAHLGSESIPAPAVERVLSHLASSPS